jgi:hypothetical protein
LTQRGEEYPDGEGDEDPDSDEQLVRREDRPAPREGSQLGEIERGDRGGDPDCDSSDQSSERHQRGAGRGRREGHPDESDHGCADDGQATARPVRRRAGDDAAEQRAGHETRHDDRGVPDGELELVANRADGVVAHGDHVAEQPAGRDG